MSDDYRLVKQLGASVDDQTCIEWRAVHDGTCLWWHVRRVLPSLGYTSKTHHTEPHIILNREMKGLWKRFFAELDVPMTEHVRKSVNSRRQTGSAAAPTDATN
eukprot:6465679-Amphidinium_carterae.3